jgi:ankyrin repeat protein
MPKNEITLQLLKTDTNPLHRALTIAAVVEPYLSNPSNFSIQSLFDSVQEVRASLTPSEIIFLVKHIAQRDFFAREKYNGLHYSVRTPHQYRELIEAFTPYADVNLTDTTGHTPILYLAAWQKLAIMQCFVDLAKQYNKEINFNARTPFKQTSLIFACSLRDTEMAKYLLNLKLSGAASLDVNLRDRDGRTALHYACLLGDMDTAALLIQAGAETSIEDNWGDTPLKLADFPKIKLKNHFDDMNIIFTRDEKAKQDFFWNNTDTALKVMTPQQVVPQEIVANKEHIALFKKTLKENYILNHRKYIETKEEEALNEEEKQALLKQAEVFTGKSILNASLEGQIKIRQAFTKAFIFYHEVSNGRAASVDAALKASPEMINTIDLQTNQSVLHAAVIANSVEMVKILLRHNIQIDLQDIDGNTALHLACERMYYPIIETLLAANASTFVKNSKEKSPWQLLHCAEKFSFTSDAAMKIHQLFLKKLLSHVAGMGSDLQAITKSPLATIHNKA